MSTDSPSPSGYPPKDHPQVENIEDPAASSNNSPIVFLDEEISYGKGGIRGVVQSPYIFGAAFLASMGGFSFGYDQGVISIVNVMSQFHEAFPRTETAFGKGFMTGMLELGAFIGCLFMPTLADKISRKKALSIVVVIFNIGAIMQTAANSYGLLVAGRTIGGIGVGTLAMVCRCRSCSSGLANRIGCSNLHLRNRTTQPERNPTCPRVGLVCSRRRCILLDHICDPSSPWRPLFSTAIWPSDGLQHYSRHRHSLLSLLATMACSRRPIGRCAAELRKAPPTPQNRPSS